MRNTLGRTRTATEMSRKRIPRVELAPLPLLSLSAPWTLVSLSFALGSLVLAAAAFVVAFADLPEAVALALPFVSAACSALALLCSLVAVACEPRAGGIVALIAGLATFVPWVVIGLAVDTVLYM
jgi:hypothetical protein